MNYKNYRPKHLSNIQRQDGWTMWSLSFVLGVIVLFAYIGLQLFPVYTSNSNVKNAMKIAMDNLDKNNVNRASVIKSIDTQLYLDGSSTLLNYNEDLKIERTRRELIIKINYERRIPLFFNLSLVASFENEETRGL